MSIVHVHGGVHVHVQSANPCRWLVLLAVLAPSAAPADAQPSQPKVPLRPFVTCVESLSGARLRAHWGYLNTTGTPLSREIGAANRFSETPDQGQPKTFKVGFVLEAFMNVFAENASSTWSLDDVSASADRRSHRCSAAESSPSDAVLINPAPGTQLFMGANFWNLDWQGAREYFVDQPDFATAKNPWLAQFLNDLAPYRVLRFMDWNLTNEANNPQSRWATRRPKGQLQNEPVAFEWQIDLCNRAQKDYWVNVPHTANAQYFTQLAQLIREQLDPRLRVYVEWSNEIWNGGFPQHDYARSQGQQLALPGNDPTAAYQVHQSVRVFEAFAAVFGKDNPRLVKVLAGQAGWSGPCKAQLAALGNTAINPKHTKPDVYAIAPYIHGESIAELRGAGIAQAKEWVADNQRCASSKGLPLIAYEGGQDSFSAGLAKCQQLQRDPALREIYVTFLDAMAAAGLRGPFMQYTHSGACWGLKVNTADTTVSSPKYQGVLDWLRKAAR